MDIDETLDERLRATEERLATPRVPGDVEDWAASVAASLRGVRVALDRVRTADHAELFDKIAFEDAGLMAHVEELRTHDEQNGHDLDRLAGKFEALHAGLANPDISEARVEAPIETLIEEAALILFRVRRNEVALTTWLIESFERDRGVVD